MIAYIVLFCLLLSLPLTVVMSQEQSSIYMMPSDEDLVSIARMQNTPVTISSDGGFSVFDPQYDINAQQSFDYNEPDASVWVRLSAASYCAAMPWGNKLETWTCPACKDSGITLSDVKRFNVPSIKTNGYVGYYRAARRIIVVFTGSINIKNWITNLDFGFTQYTGAPKNHLVHKGFYTAYSKSRLAVFELIAALLEKYPKSTISITGHSLGGALANHMALDIAAGGDIRLYNIAGIRFAVNGNPAYDPLHTPDDMDAFMALSNQLITSTAHKFTLSFPIVTFGQPRLGNSNFSAWSQDQLGPTSLYRVIHHQDPVPHLPPRLLDFKHTTTEVYYPSNSMKYKICSQTTGEDKSCARQFLVPSGLFDHMFYLKYTIFSLEC